MSDEELIEKHINELWMYNQKCFSATDHLHEYCLCDIKRSFGEGLKVERKRSQKLVEALVNISLDATDLTAWEQAKTVLQEYEGL